MSTTDNGTTVDAPWSFPTVRIKQNDEYLAVHGEHGRHIAAGYWLDEVREKISRATFWEQSNLAVNLAMELGEMAAQKMVIPSTRDRLINTAFSFQGV